MLLDETNSHWRRGGGAGKKVGGRIHAPVFPSFTMNKVKKTKKKYKAKVKELEAELDH